MPQEWFVRVGEQQRGPITPAKLKQYASDGKIRPTTLVRRGDTDSWVEALKIKGLFPRSETAPVPPTPTANAAPVPPKPNVPEDISAEIVVPDFSQEQPAFDAPPLIQTEPAPLAKKKTKAVAKKKSRNASSDEDDESSARNFKKKKKKKSEAAAMAAIVFFGLALIGCTAALVYIFAVDNEGSSPVATATSETDAEKSPTKKIPEIMSTVEIVATSKPSVALIKGMAGSGTGFLIEDKLLATNRHVIAGELIRQIKIHFPSASGTRKGPYKAKLVFVDEDLDLAFLEVDTSLPALSIADTNNSPSGDNVIVIGNPGMSGEGVLENVVTPGIFSSKTSIDEKSYDQLSISVNPGNSGGPVFNNRGQVIGVVTLKASMQEGLGFSIPIEDVHRRLAFGRSLPKEKLDQMRARHSARASARFTLMRNFAYLREIALKLAISVELKETVEFEEQLESEDEDDVMREVNSVLAKLVDSELLLEPVREELKSLHENYLGLKELAENPPSDSKDVKKKANELVKQFQTIRGSLPGRLGIDDQATLFIQHMPLPKF